MGSHITGPFSANGNITGTNATQTSIMGLKSLVLGQTNDINGTSYISVQNITGVHGLQIATIDSTLPVTDSVFPNATTDIRNIRFDSRAANARCGVPSLHIGGVVAESPHVAVGDTYSAITTLAVGSYTSLGANALSITGKQQLMEL